MKYVLETEFIGHEMQVDVEDDTPVMGAEREIIRQHLRCGPYKTRRGAESAIRVRKKFWRNKGFKYPPKGAGAYDPAGNYLFRPYLSGMSKKTQEKRLRQGLWQQPDHVTFRIEERVVSKQEVSAQKASVLQS